VNVPWERFSDAVRDELWRIVMAHPGEHPLHLRMRWQGGGAVYDVGPARVNPDGAFRSEIKQLLGAGALG